MYIDSYILKGKDTELAIDLMTVLSSKWLLADYDWNRHYEY